MNSNFKSIVEQIAGSEYEEFMAALDGEPAVSIRYNPLKGGADDTLGHVAWAGHGRYLPERPIFTLDPEHHGGRYYVQEASSMFLESVLLPFIKEHDKPLRALDLCAAPGGKSTHLAALLPEGSLVVANEVIAQRASILRENCQRWGSGNMVVTSSDPKAFSAAEGMFDILLIDAPCSGEGMFRKDHAAREEWSPEGVELCTGRSRRIIADAIGALRDGGLLIYSTCAFNRKENEETIGWIAENYSVKALEIGQTDSSITVTMESGIKGYRFFPHKCRGEGLFMAAMIKGDEDHIRVEPRVAKAKKGEKSPLSSKEESHLRGWLKDGTERDFLLSNDGDIYAIAKRDIAFVKWVRANFNLKYSGVEMGRLFKGALRPAHPLALFYNLSDTLPKATLSLEDALEYLRKKEIDVELFSEGINLVCYNGLAIGFVKRIGRRYNTMLPQNARILNL